jgi:hypothetical protein
MENAQKPSHQQNGDSIPRELCQSQYPSENARTHNHPPSNGEQQAIFEAIVARVARPEVRGDTSRAIDAARAKIADEGRMSTREGDGDGA